MGLGGCAPYHALRVIISKHNKVRDSSSVQGSSFTEQQTAKVPELVQRHATSSVGSGPSACRHRTVACTAYR
jgi:hypothetical protein